MNATTTAPQTHAIHGTGPTTTTPQEGPIVRRYKSPIGKLWLAFTGRGIAVLSMQTNRTRDDVLRELRARKLTEDSGDSRIAAQTKQQLDEYFRGAREAFDVAVDLRGMPDFTTKVLRELQSLSFGETITYGEMARRVDNPKGSRAVGQANGRNPVAVIVPCHRIVAGNGLGGFSGGLDNKRWLLRHEGRGELC